MMNERMTANLVSATEEVFETMVAMKVTLQTPIEGDALRPRSNVVAVIGFTGTKNGLVAFYSTLDAARDIAGGMLGIPPAEVDGDMVDAIGEVTNMIAGSFRSKMVEEGWNCAISVPTVTTGSDFYTRFVSNVRRVLCPFHFNGSREVFVELIVTQN